MSKDPAILFYTGDFLNGCTDLTLEERGQYITLLCLQHQKGHLSEKTIRLCVGSVSVDVLKKFQQDQEGNFFNARMDEEIEKRNQFIETRRVNGQKGGRPTKANGLANGLANAKATENLIEDEDDNEIINYKGVLENYLLYCDRLSKVAKLSEERKKHIDARFKEFNYDTIITVLKKVGKSEFLNGDNDRKWKADFDWIFKPTNFLKIMEGKYDNKGSKVDFERPVPSDAKRILQES